MPLLVKEIIRDLIPEHFRTQYALAERLSQAEPAGPIKQQDVQRLQNAGRNQEKQFSIFLKLLKVCEDLGVDPYASGKETEPDLAELAAEVIDAALNKTVGKTKPRTKRKGKK